MRFIACLSLLLAASCSITTASYEAPKVVSESESWTRTIDQPFGIVWEALIDHTSGTFFAIDNFEKDSGLLTLSFGASGIGEFVDGGHWTFKRTPGTDPITGLHVPALSFDGNYADYIEIYANGRLTGKMNLFVRQLEENQTEVKVRARYVVQSIYVSGNNTWSFDTGGSDTKAVFNPAKGTEPMRTMRPTHKAELSIIEAIEALAVR